MDLNEDDMAAKTANRRRQPKKKKKMIVNGVKGASESKPSSQTAKPASAPKAVTIKAASVLSFEDEEAEEPTFVVKKKKASKKAQERRVARVHGEELPKHNSMKVSGQYSSDVLNKLKSSQKTMPSDFVTHEPAPSATMAVDADAVAAPPPSMPSNEAIHLARQQRKQAREREEFIPLKDTPSARSSNRLVREDPDDVMDLDQEPMSFGDAARRRGHADRREQVQTALETADDQADLWSAQESRGLRTVVVTNGTTHLATSDQKPMESQERVEVDAARLKQLRATSASMQEVHRSHKQHMDRLTADIDSLNVSIPERQAELETVSARYNFFQETKLYLRDLLSCLDTKVPEIEDCESRMHALFKEEADLVQQRQQRDLAAWTTVLLADAQRQPHLADANVRNQLEVYRQRQQQLAGPHQQLEAELRRFPPDDDNLDKEDDTRLRQQRKVLLRESEGLMADVLDDYAEIRAIAGQFETWKRRYPDSYRQAYLTDSVKKIFKPLVSLQLLAWNPLQSDSPALEGMQWFQQLMYYGGSEDQPPADNDPDSRMVPLLVELAVVPKLAGFIEFTYDVLSIRQTSILIEQARAVLEDYELNRETDAAKALFVAIESRIQRAVTEFPGVELVSMAFEQQQPELKVLHQQTLGLCHKLIRNLLAWRAMVRPDVLQQAIGEVLFPRHVFSKFSQHEDKTYCLGVVRGLVHTLPQQWRQHESIAKGVADVVMQLATMLRAMPSTDPSSWTPMAAEVLEIVGQTHQANGR
eukprot:m.39302 g.39302  ORF g.39302 m.39302 type:complete len:759 (-) comp12660_c0_seq1:81-2357(-)